MTKLPPIAIAFLIDGLVVDVLHTDERLASIFLSEPQILNVTEWFKNHSEDEIATSLVGAQYVDGDFILAENRVGEPPFPSWAWSEDLKYWVPPLPYPNDGKTYVWDEDSFNWREFV